MYKIVYSPKAIEDLLKLRRSEPAAYKKVGKFIDELKEHPRLEQATPNPLRVIVQVSGVVLSRKTSLDI